MRFQIHMAGRQQTACAAAEGTCTKCPAPGGTAASSAAPQGPVLPELESRLSHASPNVRSVVVHSLRFTLTEEARRAVPPSTLHKFLGALGDEDLKARAFAARAFAQERGLAATYVHSRSAF